MNENKPYPCGPKNLRLLLSSACIVSLSIMASSCAPSSSEMIGKCFDLAPMKRAEVVGTVSQGGYRWLKVLQTDSAEHVSVAYVPPKVARDTLAECPK